MFLPAVCPAVVPVRDLRPGVLHQIGTLVRPAESPRISPAVLSDPAGYSIFKVPAELFCPCLHAATSEAQNEYAYPARRGHGKGWSVITSSIQRAGESDNLPHHRKRQISRRVWPGSSEPTSAREALVRVRRRRNDFPCYAKARGAATIFRA